jgi:hypothetical protein
MDGSSWGGCVEPSLWPYYSRASHPKKCCNWITISKSIQCFIFPSFSWNRQISR